MKVETILEGLGVGVLVTLPYAEPQLSHRHLVLYHNLLPSHAAPLGLLIDLVSVSTLSTLLFVYLKKKHTGLRSAVWSLVAAKFASVLFEDFSRISQPLGVVTNANRYPGPGLIFTATLIAGLTLYRFRAPAYRSGVMVLRVLLLLVGFSALWMIPELLYLGVNHQPIEFARFEHAAPAVQRLSEAKGSAEKGRRIVWLLFDELSYNQAFVHPYPGLALPAFDRLKRESVSFEALRPAGYFTDRVIPSFFLGNVIEDIKSDLQGRAQIQVSGQEGWHAFDSHATLFAEARRAAWTTGVVGWFNPYCRILAGSLDSCFWRPSGGQVDGFMLNDSVWEGALAPIRGKTLRLVHGDNLHRQDHEEDLTVLMREAQRLIRDENIRFVFIHLPVPHPPGIYDRRTGRMRAGGTYIDNLALADRSLGELMAALSATPSASETTLIVCSDHSWRVPIWRSWPGWTKEEEAASQGKFDTRPVLMIHFPGQSSEVPVTQPFAEIRLHDILLNMLRNDLNSPADLIGWLQGNPARPADRSLDSGLSRKLSNGLPYQMPMLLEQSPQGLIGPQNTPIPPANR